MRVILVVPLMLIAACSVQKDNGQTTVEINGQPIEDLGNAAEEAISDVGNAASEAGQAIENDVDNLDVDIDVNRDRQGNSH